MWVFSSMYIEKIHSAKKRKPTSHAALPKTKSVGEASAAAR